jgi:aspartyl-tRNA(Asn)/glutamyl-tRNA(Gln) amidotransferase subunit A
VDDATAVAARVRGGEVSATEVAREALERAPQLDDGLGAIWLLTEERALAEARAVDEALARGDDPGPLAGVPVGWKDLIDTARIRTTYGSAIWRDNVPERDADVVARVSAAGGVAIAKLATHELAWGTTTDNIWFGTCRNPHDRERVPGGSSGGSAAALAAGAIAFAPGTDTGGSIRIPASCCGVVGLKPTYGRVSLAGIHGLCLSYDHCGPMARSVRDCALGLEVMAGASPRDPRTPAVPVERYGDAIGRGVAGLTIGIEESLFALSDDPIAAVAMRAVEALGEAGARLVPFDLGWPPEEAFANDMFYMAETAATLAGHWPARRADLAEDIAEDVEAAQRLGAVEIAELAGRRLAYCADLLGRAQEAGIDLIASPTQATTPPPIGTTELEYRGRLISIGAAMCGPTEMYDVTGWPAISVPCGQDPLGLPVGLQLAGLPWRESDCLAAAAVLSD